MRRSGVGGVRLGRRWRVPEYGVTCGYMRFCDFPRGHEGEHGAWVETTVSRLRAKPTRIAVVRRLAGRCGACGAVPVVGRGMCAACLLAEQVS